MSAKKIIKPSPSTETLKKDDSKRNGNAFPRIEYKPKPPKEKKD